MPACIDPATCKTSTFLRPGHVSKYSIEKFLELGSVFVRSLFRNLFRENVRVSLIEDVFSDRGILVIAIILVYHNVFGKHLMKPSEICNNLIHFRGILKSKTMVWLRHINNESQTKVQEHFFAAFFSKRSLPRKIESKVLPQLKMVTEMTSTVVCVV